ncbi:radical SAM protein [Candidatus Dependentiae bacterium]|nr:radical SAM protein [Candidatus Dependentiae bacterium]
MHAQIARICTSFIDVPDKISVAIYFAGCSLRCKDCQNRELWDPRGGEKKSLGEVLTKIKSHPLAEAVVFLGGEPIEQIDFLQKLCLAINDKEKVLYTGREFEMLPKALLEHLNLIICGPYRSDLHTDGWPASSNQRILRKKGKQWQHLISMDIQKTFKSSTTKLTQKF